MGMYYVYDSKGVCVAIGSNEALARRQALRYGGYITKVEGK